MGFGKSFKKAIKKVTKTVKKTAGIATGGLLGGDEEPKGAVAVEAPAPAAPAAQIVEPPKAEAEGNDESQTEAGRKKARAGGKKSLSVARSSGGGLNI